MTGGGPRGRLGKGEPHTPPCFLLFALPRAAELRGGPAPQPRRGRLRSGQRVHQKDQLLQAAVSSPGRWGVIHEPRFSCCLTSSSSPGRLRDGSEYLLRAPSQPLMNEWVSKLQQNSGERPPVRAPRCRSPFGAGGGMDEPKHGCLRGMQAPALPRELRVPAGRIWRLGVRTAHTQLGIRNNRADVSRGSAAKKKKQPREDYKQAPGIPCPSFSISVGLGGPFQARGCARAASPRCHSRSLQG